MDKIDYKILNMLKKNGRETASDISKSIHLSVSAVLERIKKMEEAGIIQGYTVMVDSRALGNDVTALMEISLEHPRFHDVFTEFITDHPNIVDCYYPVSYTHLDVYKRQPTASSATLGSFSKNSASLMIPPSYSLMQVGISSSLFI